MNTGIESALALSLEIEIGGSLWSAVALYRFGNQLRFPRVVETGSLAGLSMFIVTESKMTTKAVEGYRTPKLRALSR